MENSKIEWTHHTANLWWGCTKVHAGCDRCYAETLDNRYNHENTHWGNDKPRKAVISVWNDLMKYQAAAAKTGEMHRVFVGSMMDIFEKDMPLEKEITLPTSISENAKVIELVRSEITGGAGLDRFTRAAQLRDFLFHVIIPLCPNLLFLLLTKRPSNINKYIPEKWKQAPPANVMFGTSPADQETADILIPQLAQVLGKKFLSIEPLIGPIDLKKEYPTGKGQAAYGLLMDWVIVGGESGHDARPMHPNWVETIKADCESMGIPFFFKQWGEYTPYMKDHKDHSLILCSDGTILSDEQDYCPECRFMYRVGKKEAGHMLNGQEFHNFRTI